MTKASYTYLPDLTTMAAAPPDSIVSRTIYRDDRFKAVVFAFAPGQELSEHTASTAAVIHLLQGEARVTLGADVHEMKAGAWVHMPPGLRHALLARTPVVMLLLLLQ